MDAQRGPNLPQHPQGPPSTQRPTSSRVPAESPTKNALSAASDKLFATEESRRRFRDPTPNIIFCGLPKSGKTSISRVVFCKKSPHETIYCQPTQTPEVIQVANTSLVKFSLLDVPGALLFDSQLDEAIFPSTKSLVFVIDAQNEPYTAEIAHCKSIFKRAWTHNPDVNLEVFIHKIDGDVFSIDEVRAECQREIHDKLMSHLHEAGVSANVLFYSTSIYDHTVFEASSRVVQRLIPQATALEHLLDLLLANCRMEKAFLIDVLSKTFIATDTSPFDPLNFELCTDMVEVVIEISCIYGQSQNSSNDIFSFGAEELDSSQDRGGEDKSNKPSASDTNCTTTSSLIQLNTEYMLYLREVDKRVALACVIRGENFDKQQLIDHNISVFRNAMKELFHTYEKSAASKPSVKQLSND